MKDVAEECESDTSGRLVWFVESFDVTFVFWRTSAQRWLFENGTGSERSDNLRAHHAAEELVVDLIGEV
jgi:hypothetical protein